MTPEFRRETNPIFKPRAADQTMAGAYAFWQEANPIFEPRTADQLVVGAYTRVSTPGQFEKGGSSETQLERCEQDALNFFGVSLDPRYIWVEVESGVYLGRPKLDEARRAVRDREIDVLIVFVQDRLSRDMIDPVIIVRECMEAGVRLHFVEGANDTTSLEGQFAMLATGFAAQMEHRQIAERSQRGRERVAREGRRMANGMGGDLYGYDYDPVLKCRVINEKEAVAVRMMFQLAADGLTCHTIAKELNRRKIPTKRGKLWYQTGVRRMLHNPAYTGVHYYGMTRSRRVGTKAQIVTPRPVEEWYRIEGFTPPLISQEFFDTVQQRLKTPQARWDGRTPRHLMTGFTRCGKCDGAIIGNMRARGDNYYKCTNTINKPEKPATCDARSIRSDQLEPTSWDLVSAAVNDPEMISQEILKHTETGSGNLAEETKKLQRDIVVLEGQESKLLSQFLADIISQSTLESQAA